MPPTILITRPDPAGQRFADMLRAGPGCDVPVVFSPVIRIEPCGALPDLTPVKCLIFTSRNGVTAYARQSPRRDIPCYSVGDATAELARAEGFQAISCGGNADALVARLLADKVQGPCLHIRGEHGVGEIAARLRADGVAAQDAVLYRQVALPLSDAAQMLLQSQTPVILPLFSPRSARLVFKGIKPCAPLFIAAISRAVADAVPAGIARAVLVAKSPDANSMADAVKAALAQAISLEGGNRAQ